MGLLVREFWEVESGGDTGVWGDAEAYVFG